MTSKEIVATKEASAIRVPRHSHTHGNFPLDVCDEVGEPTRAVAIVEVEAEPLSGLADRHNNLGITYHDQGQVDRAIDEYEEALRIDPDHAHAHNNLGAAHYAQGEVDLAVSEWKEALRLDSALVQARFNLGIAYKAHGKFDLAVSEWKEALRLEPNDADTCFNPGDAFEMRRKLKAAVQCYQRLLQLGPPEDAYFVRGARGKGRQFKKTTFVDWGFPYRQLWLCYTPARWLSTPLTSRKLASPPGPYKEAAREDC